MKLFLTNILKFTLFVIFIITITFFLAINLSKLNHNIFKFEKSKNILLLGDSQIECDLNDSVIENSVNIATAADIYFFSYIKLRAYINNNPQIKTVVLGLNYHNLLKSLEDEWTTDSYIQAKLTKYVFLMKYSELYEMFKRYPHSFLKASIEMYKTLLKTMVKSFVYNTYKHFNFGKFVPLKRDKIKEAIKWKITPRKIKYSEFQLKYLFRIANFCKKHNINLIFLSAPLHPLYRKNKIIEKEALNSFISKNLKNYKYLDFSTFQLPSDTFYADTWHLKYNGAEIFSEYLNKNKKIILKK